MTSAMSKKRGEKITAYPFQKGLYQRVLCQKV